jgi:hypothetical protein
MGIEQEKAQVVGELPITERKAALSEARDLAAARANAEPFPGVLKDAFLEGDIEVKTSKGSVSIRPIVKADWALLAKLNSPLRQEYLEMFKPATSRDPVVYSDEEGAEIAFQFTIPVSEARALLKKGREAFQEAALLKIGDVYTELEVNEMVSAVGRQIARSLAPLLKYKSPEDPGEVKDPNFTSAEASTTTASAGSSTTPVAS